MTWEQLKSEIRELARRWQLEGRPGGLICAPEDWIARVIELDGIDQSSLKYLANIATQHGKVNIHHALHFVDIEEGVRERRAAEARLQAQVSASPVLRRLASRAAK